MKTNLSPIDNCKRLKVAVISKVGHPLPYIGGAEKYSFNLAYHLAKKGIETYFISSIVDRTKLPRSPNLSIISANLPLHSIAKEGTLSWIIHYIVGALSYVVSLLTKVPRDVKIIHVNHGLTAFFVSKLRSIFFRNAKIVLTLHAPPPWLMPYAKPEILYKIGYVVFYLPGIKSADHVITVNIATKRNLVSLFPSLHRKISHIPNAVDLAQINTPSSKEISMVKKKYKISRSYFLFAGRLVKEKGVHILLKAISVLDKLNFKDLLVVTGRGPLEGLINRYARKYSFLKFLGYVPKEDLCCLIAGAKAVLIPSYAEGLPTIALEALALGTPIIVSTSLLKTVNELNLPYVISFKQNNPKDLAYCLHSFDIQFKEFCSYKLKTEIHRYTWHSIIHKILNLYYSKTRKIILICKG